MKENIDKKTYKGIIIKESITNPLLLKKLQRFIEQEYCHKLDNKMDNVERKVNLVRQLRIISKNKFTVPNVPRCVSCRRQRSGHGH